MPLFIKTSSLASRLTKSVVLLTAFSTILMSLTVYMLVMNFGNNFLYDLLVDKTNFVANSLVIPVWTYDRSQVQELGKSLLVESEYMYITGVKIDSLDGSIKFKKTLNSDIDFENELKLDYRQSRSIKIKKDDQTIGQVTLVMTNEGLVKRVRNILLIILLCSILILFLGSKLVSVYFNQELTIPLNKILDQVRNIENENHKNPDLKTLPEELQIVSQALSSAATTINMRNLDIKYYTNDLEELVKERTADLELQISKSMNNARLAAVGKVAADIAHEINNPLTVIDLHITKIKKHETQIKELIILNNSLDKVQLMVKRISKIIKGLKSISRDGNNDPKTNFSVREMIEEVKMLVEMKILYNNIDFIIDYSSDTMNAYGREVQISQVLINLINNSIDAIVDNNLAEKWIKLEVKEENDYLYFFVTDSGEGINKNIDQLMNPFFTTKDAKKGTGLGLSISKNIIEEHEGSFSYNYKSKNTQFYFTLKNASKMNSAA